MIRHIEYLISRTDCVIIPGIGALLAHRQSAQFDFDNQRVVPPSRVFSFNGQLTETDGALAYSVARAESISLEAASDKVKAETEAMKRQLMLDGQLSLGRVGTLTADAESGSITFNSFAADALSIATAWLPTVEVKPAEHEEIVVETPVRPTRHWARFAKIAASVAVLLGICFVASTPIVVNDMLLASLAPELQHVAAEELLPVDVEEPTLTIAFHDEVSESVDTVVAEEQPIEEETVKEIQSVSQGDYLVIVGSFTTQEEAEAWVAKKYGQGSGVIEKNGRYRAYSASYATEAEARAAAAEIGNAWACKR
ncbi:MAG: SPOR domain-containing protein [Muribaculaceae bacterium]|nr:SPOR domain-containing protein [Muribaculaceae bacterium]